MKIITLSVLVSLALASTGALADDGDRSFLLCDGVSQTDSAEAFSFTVTLDIAFSHGVRRNQASSADGHA